MRRASKSRSFLPEHFINREASWLAFNHRVLTLAQDPEIPVLERFKFLAIFESNLDEFYMVRVSGLIEQFESGFSDLTPDGLSVEAQLRLIHNTALPMRELAGHVLRHEVLPNAEEHGIRIRRFADLAAKAKNRVTQYFRNEVFPVCTPLILYPATSIPFISNRSLNLAVVLDNPKLEQCIARVKIPSILSRLCPCSPKGGDFVLIEDLIAHNLSTLFPGVRILGAYPFRVVRDADMEIRQLEAADLLTAVEEMTRRRRFGDAVRLDITKQMPEPVRNRLLEVLQLDSGDLFQLEEPLGLEFLTDLANLPRPNLKYPPCLPALHESISDANSIFETAKRGPILLHHPFDSFRPIEEFVKAASTDRDVIGIKQTLYRVGSQSPIVESLLDAAEEGKQVAVMVELKARFDENNNLVWARALERAGVHVSYGFSDLKTHCKLCLIVRREAGSMRMYAHIGTGNYNPETARLYTDIGLFTVNPEIAKDISELFNFLTGFAQPVEYRRLLVAPHNLREGIIERIRREVKHHRAHKNGKVIFKLNSLVDPEVIEALYSASNDGVSIDLIVRGICCLRPGLPGVSDNIQVISIVGRYLEHSRAYYFGNNGQPELFLGSADLMRRNLDLRIEVLAPVLNVDVVRLFRQEILDVYLKDNMNSWTLQSDGTYARLRPSKTKQCFDSHTWLQQHPFSRTVLGASRSD